MQMPNWFYIVVAVAPVVLVGCESDAKKLQALQHEQTIACLEDNRPTMAAEVAQRMDSANHQTPAQRQVTIDSLVPAIHTRCVLATREMNKFMNGR
jgi:uncharacterized protein YcfL